MMPPASRFRLPRSAGGYVLLGALLLALSFVLVYPVLLTVRGAFAADPASGRGFTLVHLRLLFEDPRQVRGLVVSFQIAAATTALSLVLATPLAFFAARYRYPLKSAFNAMILTPLILPPFVGAIGVQMLLGREGALNTLLGTSWDILGTGRFWGVVIVEALHLYPIIYLNATAALANLDPALDEAATNLGAGPFRRFFRVTLPLIRPGLFAGSTIVFIWSFTELGTPLVFDYRIVTPVQIFEGLKAVENSAQPYALTLVMLTLSILFYTLGKTTLRGRAYEMHAKASRAATERTLSRPFGLAVTFVFALISGLALLPHIGVILTALSKPGAWYQSVLPRHLTLDNVRIALSGDEAFSAIIMSLKLSALAVALDLVIGLIAAYLLVRTRLRGRAVLDALCMLPLAVPGLVMAFGFVAMTLRWPFARGDILHGVASVFGANPNPIPLLVIAYAVRRLPYVVRAAVAGLEQTPVALEEASLNLGASRLTTIGRITVPLIAANLIAGGLLAFSFAMLEVSDSLILAQDPRHFPITKVVVELLTRLGDGPYVASALGVWGMALLAVTLVGASILIGKKLGSIFRA